MDSGFQVKMSRESTWLKIILKSRTREDVCFTIRVLLILYHQSFPTMKLLCVYMHHSTYTSKDQNERYRCKCRIMVSFCDKLNSIRSHAFMFYTKTNQPYHKVCKCENVLSPKGYHPISLKNKKTRCPC